MADGRGPHIVVQRWLPPMPIVEWWDLWYREMPDAAQLVNRMSRVVQRGFRDLSNAGQDSPAAQQQSSMPLESNPAVTTAPWASPAAESSRGVLQEGTAHLQHLKHQSAVRGPPSLQGFQ